MIRRVTLATLRALRAALLWLLAGAGVAVGVAAGAGVTLVLVFVSGVLVGYRIGRNDG